ncbi:MAG: HEAT repeat domain-containing protein [Clostridia bacterium]|nr:HEAT repeat domain-containing protein [Clostridia bacterium]
MHEWVQIFIDVLIVGMAAVLIVFTLLLFILHIISTSNRIRVERIKRWIMRILSVNQDLEYRREQIYHLIKQDSEIKTLRDIRGIRSGRGTIALSMVVADVTPEQREQLRGIILHDEWYAAHVHKKLRSGNSAQVGVFTKLIADLKLTGFEDEVFENLYRFMSLADLQEISMLALFMCGCEDRLLTLFADKSFRIILSFRQLQEVFDNYSGDRARLYHELLDLDCDVYVTRVCIRGVGAEGLYDMCPKIEPYLSSGNVNVMIETIRSLGKLRYRPAADVIRERTKHEVWSVRSTAVTALFEICPDDCYEELLSCLCDREWWVRFHAAEALSEIRGHESLIADVKALGDRFAYEMMNYMLERKRLLSTEVPA